MKYSTQNRIWWKSPKALLIFLSVGLSSFEFLNHQKIQASPLQSSELSELDLASSKTKRETNLGEASPKILKQEKEVPVLLQDPAISQAWGINSTDSQKAWKVTTGSKEIVVAIIDTGIDVRHPDLAENIWINPGEVGFDKDGQNKATNKKDDDGNGLIDDINGWNFVGNNNDLTDNHGHGTHVAGIIGAVGGNGVGISGISPKVSLMALKYFDPKSPGLNNLSNTVKAIEYAVKMNVNVINYSGGGVDPSPEEKRAIEKAQKAGILFVAAAGNERSNSDIKAYYPADYDLDNIISVTAIDKKKNVLPSSNYGVRTVDIAAPGNEIYSTFPNGKYGFLTGTSQATAFATGVAALVMANNSELKKANRIIKYLTQTGDSVEGLDGKTRYQKVLNSYKALAIQDKDLSLSGVRVENTLHLAARTFSSQEATEPALAEGESAAVVTEPVNEIAGFGKALQKAMEKSRPSQRKNTEVAAPF